MSKGKGSFGVNLGRPIVTNRAFVMHSFQITLRTCFSEHCTWLDTVIIVSVAPFLSILEVYPRFCVRSKQVISGSAM